jgi:hypothetical protein
VPRRADPRNAASPRRPRAEKSAKALIVISPAPGTVAVDLTPTKEFIGREADGDNQGERSGADDE